MFFQFEMHGGIFQSCWSLTESLRGGECITGTGGDGGPRGTRLCLNFGGSIGSSGASTIRITREDAPPAWLFPWFDGVYRMYVGALRSACARSSEPALCAAASATFFSIASRVRSEFSAATSSSGFASSSSVRFFAASAVDDEWIVFPARWPTVAIRSCRAFPVASVCSASTCEPPALPFRPMSSGYCATWISGYAPPSAKSACERGTQPLRCPCGGTLRDGGGAGAGAGSGSSSSSSRWVGLGSMSAAILRRARRPRRRSRCASPSFSERVSRKLKHAVLKVTNCLWRSARLRWRARRLTWRERGHQLTRHVGALHLPREPPRRRPDRREARIDAGMSSS